MFKLKDLSVRAKLLLSYSAVSLLAIVVGGVGAAGVWSVAEKLRIVYADYTVAGTDLAKVSTNLTRYRQAILNIQAAGDGKTVRSLNEARGEIRKAMIAPLDSYATTVLRVSKTGRDERKDLEGFRAALDEYLTASDRTVGLAIQAWEAATPAERDELREQARAFAVGQAGAKLDVAIDRLDALLTTVSEVAGDMNADGQATTETAVWSIGGGSGAALLVGLVLGYFVARWFTRAILEVNAIAVTVASASQQLAASSEELSSGAQESASSLEETASSLEEITSTVRQNADNAEQANQLAAGAKDAADKGGEVVAAAVRAMGDINEASRKIAAIIGTIDEIAFQTNLLALNAAVEAARAGEQGRGFAVVAGEVRNLAQRSAGAAKEIKELIGDSVRKVETGTDLVNRSGETLAEIVGSVKRVTDIVGEIAAACREQSAGIEQVNKAVAQMDTVTQANASQTEELSSTATALSGQADDLRAVVAQFNVEKSSRESRKASRVEPMAAAAPAPKAKSNGRPAATKPSASGHSNGRRNGRPAGHELDLVGAGTGGNRLNGHFEEF